ELRELRLVQAVVPIGQVEEAVVEPVRLVLGSGFQDAASQDVGEQLVAGLLEQGGGGHSTGFRTLLGHARRAPVSSGSGGVGARRRGRPAADDLAPQCNKRRESAQRADHGRPGGYYHQRGAGVVSGSRRGGEREPEAGAHVRKVGAWATHQTKSTVRSGRSDCWRCCAAWRSGFRRSTGRGSCSSGCPSCRSCSETRAASCFTMKCDSRTIPRRSRRAAASSKRRSNAPSTRRPVSTTRRTTNRGGGVRRNEPVLRATRRGGADRRRHAVVWIPAGGCTGPERAGPQHDRGRVPGLHVGRGH